VVTEARVGQNDYTVADETRLDNGAGSHKRRLAIQGGPMKQFCLYDISEEVYWKLKMLALLEHKRVTDLVVEMIEKPMKAKEKKYGKSIISTIPKPPKIPVRLARKLTRGRKAAG
jgi:hypothetical protein